LCSMAPIAEVEVSVTSGCGTPLRQRQ
jgi:hypothetical protein